MHVSPRSLQWQTSISSLGRGTGGRAGEFSIREGGSDVRAREETLFELLLTAPPGVRFERVNPTAAGDL
jgi:hypothetical protein